MSTNVSPSPRQGRRRPGSQAVLAGHGCKVSSTPGRVCAAVACLVGVKYVRPAVLKFKSSRYGVLMGVALAANARHELSSVYYSSNTFNKSDSIKNIPLQLIRNTLEGSRRTGN